MMQQVSDGCSWIPELWIHDCCVIHDFGSGDTLFLQCIAEHSQFLGPFGYLFAGVMVCVMCIGRPVYHWFKKRKEKEKKDGV